MNNNFQQRHAHNLKKSAGLPGDGSVRFEYILTKDELYDSYLKRMDDLGYPLKVEPKRDRYVMNSKYLEDAFQQAVLNTMKQLETEVYDYLDKEVMNVIDNETYVLLNSVTASSGQFMTNRRPIKRNSWATRMAQMFGRELAKTVMNILEDTAGIKKTRRR